MVDEWQFTLTLSYMCSPLRVVITSRWISVPVSNVTLRAPYGRSRSVKVSSQLFWASLAVSVSDEALLLIRLQRKKCWVNRTELQLRGDRLGLDAHRGDAGERTKTLCCLHLVWTYTSLESVVHSHCFLWNVEETPVTIRLNLYSRTYESEHFGRNKFFFYHVSLLPWIWSRLHNLIFKEGF